MIKLGGVICDECRKIITSSPVRMMKAIMSNKSRHFCNNCMGIKENEIRLHELERARDVINSNYYWTRKKQLENE